MKLKKKSLESKKLQKNIKNGRYMVDALYPRSKFILIFL